MVGVSLGRAQVAPKGPKTYPGAPENPQSSPRALQDPQDVLGVTKTSEKQQ